MSKEQVESIHISITVTLRGKEAKLLTLATITDDAIPDVYSTKSDSNTLNTSFNIRSLTNKLADRVAIQAISGLKDLDN